MSYRRTCPDRKRYVYLTAKEKSEIRRRYKKETGQSLAEWYGVSRSTISRVVRHGS